jgi:hypothetical protein
VKCQCGRPSRRRRPAGGAVGVDGAAGRGTTEATVEEEVPGRLAERRGFREGPAGPADGEVDAAASGGAGVRGGPALDPVSAIATPVTVATSSTPAATITRTPREKRISSSRARTAVRSADGRP